jgi:GNAT superfamily N-acetyltransferase
MEILPFQPQHADALIATIRRDPAWTPFTRPDTVERFKRRLHDSPTYVGYEGRTFAGFVRAVLDDGFAVYISELFVVPAFRGSGLGRSLLERVCVDFGELKVYVLSDEDAFYEHLGYRRIGSIFEIDHRAPSSHSFEGR